MNSNLRTGIVAISLFIILLSPILLIRAPGVSAQDPNDTSLSVGKATYVLGETVCISLAAAPEEIVFFNIISPAGIFYAALPSTDREYKFKPDSTGTYVINVLLRAGGDEKFLTTGFEVIDTDMGVVFGEPKQGEIVVGGPVNWSQHISITNHGRFSISNFSVNIPLPIGYSNLSSDAGFTIIDSSIPVDLAAGEDRSFNISYQTPPVWLEVVEEDVGIYDLIPPDAFDIGLYKQIGAENVSFPSLSTPIEMTVKRVKVWHNSSTHYRDIPITIAMDEGERLFEIVDGTEMEVSVDITDGMASWVIPELSNRTFMMMRLDRRQGDAEIDKPVEWQLNLSGMLIRYRTPAPYRIESEEVLVNGAWRKDIIVGSNASVHYRDVTAFTTLNETAGSNIKLFLLENSLRVDVTDDPVYNVSLSDRDGDSISDEIRWNVPLLSLKRFEVEYGYVSIRTLASLTSKRGHFGPDEEPEFIFKCMDEKGKKKALRMAAAEKESIKTFVYNCKGELTDIEAEIEDMGGGTFSIKLPGKRAFRAGLYRLSVELVKEEHVYVLEDEFLWGLVSLNTRKSIYKPGETAEFIIVALDKDGRPVCNADISMTVTNPNNEKTVYRMSDGTILPGEECGLYHANYPTEIEGNHTITVNALIGGVEVAFDTYFSVKQDYAFDIIRTAQSKIDPTRQDRFDVKIDVESFTDADSVTIREFVPAEFDVFSTDAASVLLEDDTKTITWNKDLIDKRTSVSYSYAVPHIWPYLYALGPAEIDYDGKTFTEARPWYVAVDPISSTYDYSTGNGTDKWAYELADAGLLPPGEGPSLTGETAFSSYTEIAASDDIKYTTSHQKSQHATHHFNFTIAENPAAITELYVEWEGCATSETNNLYIWNFSSLGWELVGSGANSAPTDNVISTTYTTGFSNYIDVNGYLHLLAEYIAGTGAAARIFYTDYVYVDVTYSDTTVTIINPKNKTYNTASLTLDASIGADASSCWYSLNGETNISFTCGTPVDITATEGSNNITVYANDTLGNIGSDIVLFSVNTSIILDMSITSPANGTITNDPTPQLTLLAIDKDYPTINYTLYIYYENGTLYSAGNSGTLNNNTPKDIVLSPAIALIGDSTTYKIIATANDSAPNYANSSDLYITLEPPWLDLIFPGYGYWDNDGNITFTFKYGSPSYSTANCSLYINGIYNQHNDSTADDTETTFNVTGLAEGKNQNWTINATMNGASWISVEDTSIFHVDKTVPAISIDVPTNESPVYRKGGELFWVNFTYTELNPKFYMVDVGNSSYVINTTTVNYPAGGIDRVANVSFNLSSTAADGWYNVSVEMYDNSSNHNISYENESVVKMSWSNVTWISPPDPREYTVGDTITLTCLVRDANTSSPIANYPVHFYNKTDVVTHDFGVNYTNSSGYAVMDWNTTGVAAGWYYPKCNITDNSTLFYNVTAPYEANTSIELTTLSVITDLRVINVTFDNWETGENKASVSETGTGYHIKEGGNITVNATIANYGTGNVTSDFNVSFFDSAGVSGDWSTWFGNYTYNVSAEGELGNTNTGYPYNTTYATAYWDSSLVGTHNISAWADPDNSTGEPAANVTDNNASALINVSAWQKYWGNVSGSIALADSASDSLYGWTWNNETDVGCAYIVTAGASINWSALHALGCDVDDTLNTSGQDFLDADTNLAMSVGINNATGFADNNITQLFSGGDPSNATNRTYFIVYGTNITNVSIVNSTDMTNHTSVGSANFVTGILWDATLDNNGYYDTADDETLVFVTRIRVAATGIGSTAHNYEFAAPCALNPAVGGDLDFYMELK